MKKGWKIFWTVIISLTGAGVVFVSLRYALESHFHSLKSISEWNWYYKKGLRFFRGRLG